MDSLVSTSKNLFRDSIASLDGARKEIKDNRDSRDYKDEEEFAGQPQGIAPTISCDFVCFVVQKSSNRLRQFIGMSFYE
ncbi:hypothetical protein [Chlorobium ferrooxidans]|uniref:hypothetical protein n=1 Tax=Chlorobium ferrooxidans TaxID=84205 RepID=UPI000590E915|nr:hypothetical protein [Chlorobium ferrooxidans]